MPATSAFLRNSCLDAMRPFATISRLSAKDVRLLATTPLNSYAMLIADNRDCCNSRHGRTKDDFAAATVLFRPPQKAFSIGADEPKKLKSVRLLCFNRKLFERQTPPLGDYTFFSYHDNEALHISEKEDIELRNIIKIIETELSHDTDNISFGLLSH